MPVIQHSLHRRAWTALGFLVVVLGMIVFGSAGTVYYWQGWLFLVVFMTPAIAITGHLLKNDSALVERWMRRGSAGETRTSQKRIQAFNLVFFVALLVLPGLDRRFGSSNLPAWTAMAGGAMVLVGYLGLFGVMKANSFASGAVELAEGQTVVSTGLYGLLRHPMYAAGLLLIAGTPLALGSLWGLAPAAALLAGIIWRLLAAG